MQSDAKTVQEYLDSLSEDLERLFQCFEDLGGSCDGILLAL